jgi:hypothetical protein
MIQSLGGDRLGQRLRDSQPRITGSAEFEPRRRPRPEPAYRCEARLPLDPGGRLDRPAYCFDLPAHWPWSALRIGRGLPRNWDVIF